MIFYYIEKKSCRRVFTLTLPSALIFLCLSASTAFAAGKFSVNNSTITLPKSLTIPANTAAGTVVWTSDYVTSDLKSTTGSYAFSSTYMTTPTSSGYGENIFATGVPGLGFRLTGLFKTPSNSSINQVFCSSCREPEYAWSDASAALTQKAALQLIVTGTLGAGTVNITTHRGRLRYNLTNGIDATQSWNIGFAGTTSVTTSSCTVGTYDTLVDLGTVYTQAFKSVGTTSTSVDFSIGITCNSTSLAPTITFSGTKDTNVSTVFANTKTGNGVATGVGVQLLYNNTAIVPDSAISLGVATSTSEKVYTFNARMYQTLSSASAGSLTAPVTFTLDYSAS